MERLNVNGFNIYLMPDTRLKTATFMVYIRLPLKKETASQNAVFPAVLTRGCKKYPETRALNIALEELFGATMSFHVEKQGAYQVISFKFKTVSDNFAEGSEAFSKLISLAFEVLYNPYVADNGFDKDYTEREKQVQLQFVDGLMNDKRKWANIRLIQEMCKGEEFSVQACGEREGIKALNEKSLFEGYKNAMETAKISMYVTDNFNKDEILSLLKNLLADKKASAGEEILPYIKSQTEPETFEESENVTQGKLAMGFRTNITRKDKRYYAMMVFNRIFGGSPYSKLFLNVREKLSLAYYASSTFNSQKGLLLVNSGIEFKNYESAKAEILVQLDEMKQGNFSDEDIANAKTDILDTFTGIADFGELLADFNFALENAGVTESPEEVIDKVMKVTKEEIVEVSNTIWLDTVYFLKGENE